MAFDSYQKLRLLGVSLNASDTRISPHKIGPECIKNGCCNLLVNKDKDNYYRNFVCENENIYMTLKIYTGFKIGTAQCS